MRRILALLILALVTGCTSYVQTTSGQAYLERHKAAALAGEAIESGLEPAANGSTLREKVIEAARIEPTLTFPARIGIARIEDGRLVAMPGREFELWDAALGDDAGYVGEIIPVNPMIADLAVEAVGLGGESAGKDAIARIRLAAARQHLDAVLAYEVYAHGDSRANMLSIADITVIGAFLLPSRSIDVEAYATGILIDVIEAYPYGLIEARVERSGLATAWTSSDVQADKADLAKLAAVENLTNEAHATLLKLMRELERKSPNLAGAG